MAYELRRLAELLQRAFANVIVGAVAPGKHARVVLLGGSGTIVTIGGQNFRVEGTSAGVETPTLSLVDAGVDALDELCAELLKDPGLEAQVGRSAIRKRVLEAIRMRQGKAPEGDLLDFTKQEILKPLRASVDNWTAFVPVVNLTVDVPLTLGDVTFLSREVALAEVKTFLDGHKFAGDEVAQRTQRDRVEQHCIAPMQAYGAYAKVSAISTGSGVVTSTAADRALFAVNVLRAFTHTLHPRDHRAIVAIPPEGASAKGHWPCLALGQGPSHTFHFDFPSRGPLFPFTLDKKTIKILLEDFHLESIQPALAAPPASRSSLDTAVLQALQALGSALVAPTLDSQLVGYVIALERMLIKDEEETTVERFSDRLALFLAVESAHRAEVSRSAKRIYGTRSDIVHAAGSGTRPEDVERAEGLALEAMLGLLGRMQEWSTHAGFCDFLNQLKFK